ncbi:MAG: DUF3089 domain-containing protein [Deltaproteobacteria bacterium]|nr:DUF3089 domain-containing protein [Deltaproteobacteria bacterium]
MATKLFYKFIALAGFTLLMGLLGACEDDSGESAPVSGTGGMDGAGTGGAGTIEGSGGAAGTTGGSGGAAGTTAGSGGTDLFDAGGINDGASTTSEAGPGDATADAAPVPENLDYSDPTLWMCKPGATDNPCEGDFTATEVLADLTTSAPVAGTIKQDAAFDCFYLYPTMDLETDENGQYVPGNHTDLTDVALFKATAASQAARFSSVCKVYAPYYRQMKIGSYHIYQSAPADFQKYFDFAYNDVADAFDYYMANFNAGRDIVFISHSQGSHMLTNLVSAKFDKDPEMRNKLISALLIGTSDLFVPKGQKVGATFANIPLCSSNSQTGCVVAYNTVSAPSDALFIGVKQPTAEQEVACVNPAALGGGSANLISYVTTASYPVEGVTTPFALFKNYFSAQCSGTIPALVITPTQSADEKRVNPFDFTALAKIMQGSTNSLHLIDIDLTLGNLVELVKAQGDAKLPK